MAADSGEYGGGMTDTDWVGCKDWRRNQAWTMQKD